MPKSPRTDPLENVTVGLKELARYTGYTTVWLDQLKVQGVISPVKHGTYEVIPCLRAIFEHVRKRRQNQHEGDPNTVDGQTYEAHRARLTKAKADVAEIEAALLKGQSHDAAAVAKVWADMIGNARTKLLAMPTKLAAQLEGMSIAERQDALRESINAALTELADYRPEVVTGEYVKTHRAEDAEAEEDDDAAAA